MEGIERQRRIDYHSEYGKLNVSVSLELMEQGKPLLLRYFLLKNQSEYQLKFSRAFFRFLDVDG